MPIAVGHGKGAGGDRQRLLRGITGARLTFASQHLGDVVIDRHGLDARSAVSQGTAKPYRCQGPAFAAGGRYGEVSP